MNRTIDLPHPKVYALLTDLRTFEFIAYDGLSKKFFKDAPISLHDVWTDGTQYIYRMDEGRFYPLYQKACLTCNLSQRQDIWCFTSRLYRYSSSLQGQVKRTWRQRRCASLDCSESEFLANAA